MTAHLARARTLMLVLLLAAVCALPMFAGSAVIGSVAGSINATISGQAILPNTTVLSGDSVQVRDGMAVVSLGKGSRMIFGRETLASFLRGSEEVTVLMSRGNVAVYHPADGSAVLIKAGNAAISPAQGFATQGEIAMVGDTVVVSAREGTLKVLSNGRTTEVTKGRTISVNARASRSSDPQAGIGAGLSGGVSTGLQVGSLAASGTAAVVGGIAISRAGDAKTLATSASSNAAAAAAAAASAQAAASTATSTATAAGCAVNAINSVLAPGSASPFTPPSGTC